MTFSDSIDFFQNLVYDNTCGFSYAGMMELVDMRDLGSRAVMRWGSSPHARTTPLEMETIAMNIKEKIEELVEKIQNDKDLRKKFEKEPVAALEELLGVDLPDDQVEQLIDGIKAKLTIDNIGDALGMLGGLLGKQKD